MSSDVQTRENIKAGTVPTADDELDLKLVFKNTWELVSRRKGLLLCVTALAIAIAVGDYFLFRSYSISGTLLFETQSSNAGLRALLGSLDMADRVPTTIEDAEDQKSLLALESSAFRRVFTDSLLSDPNFKKYELEFHRPTNFFQYLKRFALSLFNGDGERQFSAPMPIRVRFIKHGILGVSFRSADREAAVLLANHYLKSAAKHFSSRESVKIQDAKDYIRAKIEETIRKMEDNEKRIVGASTKNASTSFLAPPSAVGEKLLDLREQIQKAEFSYEQNEKVIDSLKAKLGVDEEAPSPTLAAPTTSPEPPFLSTMMGVRRTIANLQTENGLLEIKIRTLKSGLSGLLKTNLTLPKDELHLAGLKRSQGLDFYLFDNLIKTLLQIEVKGLSLLSRVAPLETLNTSHVGVTTTLPKEILLATLIALLLTVGGLFAIDYINPVVRRKSDFASLDLAYLGELAKIPLEYFDGRKLRICQFNIESKETMAFKHARARLTHLSNYSGTERRKVISFLSYGSGEGKSFISSNLAACFAQSGHKTLFIDFDLRRGAITKMFDLKSNGICEYLNGDVTSILDTVVPNVSPNLDFVPAGRWSTDVTERFSNAEFRAIINQLKPGYDFIVLDTAPLVVAHESLAIAQDSDFAVLLCTAWKTRQEYILAAMDEIRNVRNACVHVFLNHAKEVSNQLIRNYYYMKPKKDQVQFIRQPSLTT